MWSISDWVPRREELQFRRGNTGVVQWLFASLFSVFVCVAQKSLTAVLHPCHIFSDSLQHQQSWAICLCSPLALLPSGWLQCALWLALILLVMWSSICFHLWWQSGATHLLLFILPSFSFCCCLNHILNINSIVDWKL